MSRRSQIDGPLAEALARGETLAKAAEVAGCSVATAKRRWSEPAFRRRVIEVQEEGRRERAAVTYASWPPRPRPCPTPYHPRDQARMKRTLRQNAGALPC